MKVYKTRRRFNVVKLIENMFTLFSVIFIILCFIGYIEILCKNVYPDPQYSSWNILVNMINGFAR